MRGSTRPLLGYLLVCVNLVGAGDDGERGPQHERCACHAQCRTNKYALYALCALEACVRARRPPAAVAPI